MKANRTPRAHAPPAGDDGVSTVLGGILFFALVVLVLVTIQTDFAPKWEEDEEAAHMSALRAQVASIKSEADRQAANATSQPVGLPLSLERATMNRFLTSGTLPATVGFEPGVAGVHLEAEELLVFSSGGQSVAGASETWTDVGGTSIVADATDFDHLRLRLIDVAGSSAGDSVTITVTDADGAFAGSLTAYIAEDPPDKFVNTRVQRADNDTIYDQGVSFHQVSGINFWWIDALADELQFIDVLAAAKSPLTLTLTENGMQGQFTATYVESSSGQPTGTAGKLLTDFSHDQPGGSLSVEARNARFPSQIYHLQAGAVILEQGDGRIFVAPPLFTARADATTTHLSLTLPSLTGTAASAGGARAATVVLDGGSGLDVSGTAPHLTVRLDTSDADLWANHLRDRLEAAGLDDGADEFSLDTSVADRVTLTVWGRTTDPGSAEHDLFLELHLAPIDVRIET